MSTPGPSGEEIPMTKMNRGQEKGSKTAETFFTESDSLEKSRITMANLQLQETFSEYGKNGKALSLVVDKGRFRDKVIVVGPRGG